MRQVSHSGASRRCIVIGILSGATQVNQAFVDASWHELMPGEALDSGQLGVGGWGLVLLRPGELPSQQLVLGGRAAQSD